MTKPIRKILSQTKTSFQPFPKTANDNYPPQPKRMGIILFGVGAFVLLGALWLI